MYEGEQCEMGASDKHKCNRTYITVGYMYTCTHTVHVFCHWENRYCNIW